MGQESHPTDKWSHPYVMVATCTAVPLATPPEVMIAVKLPVLTGFVENVTVSDVAEALVTVPTAPLLKTTVLLASTALKPNPVMTTVDAVRARLVVLEVTTGRTFAT